MLAAIDVRDLMGRPGASREEPVVGTVEGLATELARVPEDAPIRADLVLESLMEGILVSGHLGGRWSLRCARCLVEFEQPFHLDLDELFVRHPDEDSDAYPLGPEGHKVGGSSSINVLCCRYDIVHLLFIPVVLSRSRPPRHSHAVPC